MIVNTCKTLTMERKELGKAKIFNQHFHIVKYPKVNTLIAGNLIDPTQPKFTIFCSWWDNVSALINQMRFAQRGQYPPC